MPIVCPLFQICVFPLLLRVIFLSGFIEKQFNNASFRISQIQKSSSTCFPPCAIRKSTRGCAEGFPRFWLLFVRGNCENSHAPKPQKLGFCTWNFSWFSSFASAQRFWWVFRTDDEEFGPSTARCGNFLVSDQLESCECAYLHHNMAPVAVCIATQCVLDVANLLTTHSIPCDRNNVEVHFAFSRIPVPPGWFWLTMGWCENIDYTTDQVFFWLHHDDGLTSPKSKTIPLTFNNCVCLLFPDFFFDCALPSPLPYCPKNMSLQLNAPSWVVSENLLPFAKTRHDRLLSSMRIVSFVLSDTCPSTQLYDTFLWRFSPPHRSLRSLVRFQVRASHALDRHFLAGLFCTNPPI